MDKVTRFKDALCIFGMLFGFTKVQRDIILSQAIHESGNFKSRGFLSRNNAFGIGRAYKRKQYGILSSDTLIDPMDKKISVTYAIYKDVVYSALDIYLYLRANNITNFLTPVEYATALKNKGYYTDSLANYTNSLTKIYKNI